MNYKEIADFETDKLTELCGLAEKNSYIDPQLFSKYEVKRGLRDISGRGVLAGLTEIGEVHSYIMDENEMVPVPGQLIYRGINIDHIVNGFLSEERFGFEETCYLLLFGTLPDQNELRDFEGLLAQYRKLPEDLPGT